MKKVLIFAPHPDDEVIGCGGQISNHTAQGDTVVVVFLTNGEAGDLDIPANELATIRKVEAETAGNILGITTQHWLGLPDGGVMYDSQTVNRLTAIIRTEKPDVIYGPHASDAHTDHRAGYQLLAEAINRAGSSAFPTTHAQPWRTATWLSYEVWTPLSQPQFCVNITPHREQLLSAMRAYRSQLKNIAYDEALLGLATYRGAMSGTGKLAECFSVEKITTVT